MDKPTELNGVAYGLDASIYHAQRRLSASGLKELMKSPAHYLSWLSSPPETSKAMTFGSALHAYVLEPEEFEKRYVVNTLDKRTKAGKERSEEILAAGQEEITQDDFESITAMGCTIAGHGTATELLTGGKAEVSVFTELAGVPVKCRADYLLDGICVDVKTCQSASPLGFRKQIANYDYWIQASWYLMLLEAAGLPCHTFIFLAIEKDMPHGIGLYEMDAASIQYGQEECYRLLNIYKDCEETGIWPCYSTDIEVISLPSWKLTNI